MQVNQLMNSSVVSVTPDETASNAARLLQRHNIGSLPVISSDGKLRGIVTDRDIVIRCVAGECNPEQTRIREIMTRSVICVPPDADVKEAAAVMASEQVRRLPVVTDGKLVGLLSLGDLSRSRSYDMEASRALSEISNPNKSY